MNDRISTYRIYRFETINKKNELFKRDLLKKQFERFQNKVLINVLECGLY